MLDTEWIEGHVTEAAGNPPAAGRLRCNWGTIEVTLLGGWPGVSDRIVSAGGAFAHRVNSDPEQGYTRDGAITARGMELGLQLLASLRARCQAIAANAEAVAARLQAYRQECDAHKQTAALERAPLLARRTELKAGLKSGALTDEAYQPLLATLAREFDDIDARCTAAQRSAMDGVREWCIVQLGVPIDTEFLERWFDTIVA